MRTVAKDRPQVGKYSPNYRLTEARVPNPNLNRDANPLPHDQKRGRPKSPTPTTYKIEKKDWRKVLST